LKGIISMDEQHFMFQQLLTDSNVINAGARHTSQADCQVRIKRGRLDTSFSAISLLEGIRARRAQGQSLYAIAADLNKQGFTGRCGGRWYASSVWMYLQRRSFLESESFPRETYEIKPSQGRGERQRE
jgi:hypothetical protein